MWTNLESKIGFFQGISPTIISQDQRIYWNILLFVIFISFFVFRQVIRKVYNHVSLQIRKGRREAIFGFNVT